MTLTQMELQEPEQREARGAPAGVATRVRAMGQRFPSAAHGLLSIFDQAIVSGTSFLTAAIVGRLTSPDEFGIYYLLLSIVLIVSGVQEQVIAGPYMVLSKRRTGSELAEYGGSVWLHHLVLTLLVGIMLVVAIGVCSTLGNRTMSPGLWALLGAGPLLLLRDGIRRFTIANLQLKPAIALDATVAVVQLSALLLLGLSGRLSLLAVFGVMGGACVLACLGWYLLAPARVQFKPQRFLSDWRHNWAFGRWALWGFAVGGTTTYVMYWVLGLTIEPTATAMLGACTTLVGITNVVLVGVSNVLTPITARAFVTGGRSELRRILLRTAAFMAVFMGSFLLFVAATGDWLVVLVFGPDYQQTGAILFAMALSALLCGQGMVAGNGLWAIGQPRFTFASDVCGMFVTLVTASVLLLPLGALGAALAILSGALTTAAVRGAILIRFLVGDAVEVALPADAALCHEGTYP